MTIEQIKTLINGLKLSIEGVMRQAEKQAEQISKALECITSKKMDKENPSGTGSFSLNRNLSHPLGQNSVAVGSKTSASGESAFAEGRMTSASGAYSHAEGASTMASGMCSHAEGQDTSTIGAFSHAEGVNSIAEGACAHAEGGSTTAEGAFSHAEGSNTIVHGESTHVQGKYNIPDADALRNRYAHIVGNGPSNANRSNAHTLDWEGNAWFQGDVLVGSTSGTNKDDGSIRLAKINEVIPAPVKAEVGQTVVVSAVDENGVPTAWEATTPSAVQLIIWEDGD